ncbi:MAG TPA: hypothetical protein VK864_13040, partial [Longimicrobiales bacterium]|nr:hypothetical protein [Longimicrobiales bacterium]
WTGAAAQSMGQMEKMDKMDVSYTGCLAAGKAGTFTLTHAAAASASMADDAMHGGSMKHDDMMKKDGQGMKSDTMMKSMSFTLSSTSVDFRKYVGQKVLVTGSPAQRMDSTGKEPMAENSMGKDSMSQAPPAFTAKSLKVLSSSCS